MTRPKPRRGRPPRTDKAATERIEIRVTRLERAAWNHKAIEAGVSLSEWIRAACQFAHAVFPRVPLDIEPARKDYHD